MGTGHTSAALTRRHVLIAANLLMLQACSGGAERHTGSAPVTITWFASSLTTSDQDPRQSLIDAFQNAYPLINIDLIATPSDTDENRTAVHDAIIGKGNLPSPDLYLGDVIWPAEFGAGGLALPLDDYLPASFWTRFPTEFVDGASYNGKIYAVPFYADQGVLFYRKDLLAAEHLTAPRTWEELAAEAAILLRKRRVSDGFVWQGAPYEGLTCAWTEFAADADAPLPGSGDSAFRIDTPGSLEAVSFMRTLVTSGVSPIDVTGLREPQAEQIFKSGHAAFLRGWTSSFVDMEDIAGSPVRGKVGVTPLPTFAGGSAPGASTIGGWDLFVNPHTRYLRQVLTFIDWLTNLPAQYVLARYGIIPTNVAVRSDPTLQRDAALKALSQARPVHRPSGNPAYRDISKAIYASINRALRGFAPPATALRDGQQQLDRILQAPLR